LRPGRVFFLHIGLTGWDEKPRGCRRQTPCGIDALGAAKRIPSASFKNPLGPAIMAGPFCARTGLANSSSAGVQIRLPGLFCGSQRAIRRGGHREPSDVSAFSRERHASGGGRQGGFTPMIETAPVSLRIFAIRGCGRNAAFEERAFGQEPRQAKCRYQAPDHEGRAGTRGGPQQSSQEWRRQRKSPP